jgi:hypothetical protein
MEPSQSLTCSAASLHAGEALFASQSQAVDWLLLEYPGAWGAKAVEESCLPEAVRRRLLAFEQAAGRPRRVQLIRRGRPLEGQPIHWFACRSSEQAPRILEGRLESYADLLSLDLEGLFAEQPPAGAQTRREALFLVCTHGRRDRCCARAGLPVYEALLETQAERVWQTSHVGGHRFAANLVCFPHGIGYGRLTPQEAQQAAAAYLEGRLVVEKLRGRACHPAPVQAAEYFLRSQRGLDSLEAARLARAENTGGGAWQVIFTLPGGGQAAVHLQAQTGALEVLTSCGDERPSLADRYRLERLDG